MNKWTRRAFIGAGTISGGGFLLGVAGLTFAPSRHSLVPPDAAARGQLTTWITIAPDNAITILIPHCEMGQGTPTALAMMTAEELDADWSLVRVEEAPALDAYANGYVIRAAGGEYIPAMLGRGIDYAAFKATEWFGFQVTGGSTAVRSTGEYGMRVAGAAARQMLVQAAAAEWQVPAAECVAKASRVTHAASNRSRTFGELARAAAAQKVPTSPALKSADSFTLRRTSPGRLDILSKVDGSAKYAIDVVVPGMLYAAVAMAPVHGGALVSVDAAPAEAMPGVKKVVPLKEAVAVVADSFWRARKALAALSPQFSDAGHGAVSTASIFAAFEAAIGAGPAVPASAATRDRRLQGAVPRPRHDGADGVHGQGRRRPCGSLDRRARPAQRTLDRCQGAGARRRAGQAHEPPARRRFRPASSVHLRLRGPGRAYRAGDVAGAGEDHLDARKRHPARLLSGAALSRHTGALAAKGVALAAHSFCTGGGNGEAVAMPYAIAEKTAEERESTHPIRPGQWRSVLNSQHGFFKESFIDEMALAAGADPFTFRRALLSDQPRFRATLEKAAEMSGWGTPLPAGEGRGIAICESLGTIVAEVAHVAVSAEGALKVLHVYAAVDCGDVVHRTAPSRRSKAGSSSRYRRRC